MSEPFIGEIILFAGNFEPRGWAFCNGQILSIAQNTALFSILGTTYGGNGQTTFALPDLRSRVPVHSGNGSAGTGLSSYQLGQQGGSENVTLTIPQMPQHNHPVNADASNGGALSPSGGNLAQTASGSGRGATTMNTYTTGTPAAPVQLVATTVGAQGGSQGHPNIQPYLGLNFIIAIEGLYPSRN